MSLTQFVPKWLQFWLFPYVFSVISVGIGWLMPWEHVWLYPLQAVLLTLPAWILSCMGIVHIVVLVFSRKRWWIHLIGIALAVYPLFLYHTPSPKDVASLPGTNVLVSNVNAYTGNVQFVQNYFAMMHVDILVLLEKRGEEIEGMKRVADDFSTPVHKPSHHIAVFCREECRAWVSPQIGSNEMKMSFALVQWQPQLCLLAIHAPPPVPVVASGIRPYIEYLEKYIENGRVKADWEVCHKDDAVVVIGDFNAVPFSWPHRQLIDTGLEDKQLFAGIQSATWPSGGRKFVNFPFFRIDNVLSHPEITMGVEQIAVPDSDHQGLLLRIVSSAAPVKEVVP